MIRFVIGTVVGVMAILFFLGCDAKLPTSTVGESSNTKGAGSIFSANAPIDSIGIYHGVICDSVSKNEAYNTGQSFAWNVRNLSNRAHYYLKVKYNYDTSDIPRWVQDTIIAKETAWYSTPVRTLFPDYHAVALGKTCWDSLCPADKAFADSLTYYFTNLNVSGYTWQQIASQVTSKASSLLTAVNGASFTGPLAGECAKGIVQIMGNSASLWGYKIGNTSNDDPRRTAAVFVWLVQADAAGYIAGWVNASKIEITETGHLDPANAEKRIKAGLDGAIQASSLGFLNLGMFD